MGQLSVKWVIKNFDHQPCLFHYSETPGATQLIPEGGRKKYTVENTGLSFPKTLVSVYAYFLV